MLAWRALQLNLQRLLPWSLFCAVSGVIFLAYASASLAAGRGTFLMPLDDTYIHFQYAKQLALGQPFVYNPGQPATSGATSLLYPFVLAAGYLLGFQDLNLGPWAMIVGTLALLGSMALIYRLAEVYDAPAGLAVLAALSFALTGAVAWHFMSGMETGLMILLTLATLYTVITGRLWWFVGCASALTLMRPEGGILAALAVGVMVVTPHPQPLSPGGGERAKPASPLQTRRIYLLIPVLMLGVQPLVNLIFTGSVVATGSSVKSILATVPSYWNDVLRRILDNFARMWIEWGTGSSPREGMYVWAGISIAAVVGLIALLTDRQRRWIGLLILAWLVVGAGMIATLETAFWHFKRYQMPLMALFFPLATWGVTYVARVVGAHGGVPFQRYSIYTLCGLVFVPVVFTTPAFWRHFVLNVHYVYAQPYQMALWLREHTPEDVVIAVHDVGLMRYAGGRTTLDMVGLTTPGAAAYWRSGPGAVAEFLLDQRPDYIASYGHGHGYGLGMIADTSIYGEPLVTFPVKLDDHFNVALAADTQGIYQPDWERIAPGRDDFSPDVQILDVANLESEAQFDYRWSERTPCSGFPTYIEELAVPVCRGGRCAWPAAGRCIDGVESFSVRVQPGQNLLLATYVHAAQKATTDVYVNGAMVDRNWIPEMPGYGIPLPVLIPGDVLAGSEAHIRIVPDGDYLPALHVLRQSDDLFTDAFQGETLAAYQDGAVMLKHARVVEDRVELYWGTDGSAQGDYKLFVHIIDSKGTIAAQVDQYPGNGTLPPGNWLPEILVRDTIVVNLDDIPPGTYQVAVGLYDPYTFERLEPTSDTYEISDGRLFIGEIEIE